MPLKIPSARARSFAGYAALRSVSPSGITSAAPAPWMARAAISEPTFGASAQAAEASEKSPSPAANSRRRPNRSPSAAPVISSTAKLSVYALTVHSSCSIDAPRWTRIVGSAVVTTSASSATISDAMEATASTQPGLRAHLFLLEVDSGPVDYDPGGERKLTGEFRRPAVS